MNLNGFTTEATEDTETSRENLQDRQDSTEKLVELVVCSDPCPRDRITVALADSTVLIADSNRPDSLVPAELLKLERWMRRILLEEPISFAGFLVERLVSASNAFHQDIATIASPIAVSLLGLRLVERE